MLGYAYTLADARGVMALQQHNRHRIADDCKEYCSVTANVMGIKFYHGVVRMSSMMHVYLERETHNHFDHNSILKSGEMLGHLERKVADVLAPLMDLRIAGFAIKCLILILVLMVIVRYLSTQNMYIRQGVQHQ